MSNIKKYNASAKYRKIRKEIKNAVHLSEVECAANSKNLKQISVQTQNIVHTENIPDINLQRGEASCSGRLRVVNDVEAEVQQVYESSDKSEDSRGLITLNKAESIENHDNDDEESDESNIAEANRSKDFLKNWAIQNNVTHSALTELLKWFTTNPIISHLPISARTILSTPNTINVEKHSKGDFYYFGLQNTLTKFALNLSSANPGVFHLDFGIVGLPIHNNNNTSFWPILCRPNVNNRTLPVFTVAIFCGKSKPSLIEFFEKFVDEMSYLLENGLTINTLYK